MPKSHNLPIPDPTTLTTEALAREILHVNALQTLRGELVDEKFTAITKLIEEIQTRHQQRFDAQTKALDAAFLSAQTAVGAALTAADKGIQAAMQASEKAVAKAEAAAEKRFDALMEFQKSSNAVAAEQIPRKEAETRLDALAANFAARLTDVTLKIDDLKMFSASSQGRATGLSLGWALLVGGVGVVSTVIAIVKSLN